MTLAPPDGWAAVRERLLRFVARRVSDPQDAEDVLQDVFLRLVSRAGDLRDAERLEAWLYRVARNAIVDHYRRRARPIPTSLVPPDEEGAAAALREELAACVPALIDELPAHYRQALRLTDLGDLTQAEAAGAAGISVSGMKTRVQRARRRLHESLLACCHFELDARNAPIAMTSRDDCCE